MLEPSYNGGLIAAALAISLMAAFTGLSMTRQLALRSPSQRQARIAMGAIALGGGIWSMHFIAMLAVSMPVPVTYDVLPTLASALIAILLSGVALLIMHFAGRRPQHIVAAGASLGLGIAAMHYTGMEAMQLCQPVYSPPSIGLALLAALVMGVLAIWAAYGRRTRRNILFGTAVLGSSVVVVHFAAMAGTGFLPVASPDLALPVLAPQEVAVIVLVSAFLICSAFLLSGATFLTGDAQPQIVASPAPPSPAAAHREPEAAPGPANGTATGNTRIPIERRGHTEFVDTTEIAALRAEGHYTIAYCCEEKYFCPWSISEAERRLRRAPFIRSHRSYLVNLSKITGFERHRDGGVCLFEGNRMLDRVPVSRNRVASMREALGL